MAACRLRNIVMRHTRLSTYQISALAAVFAICVATLLLLAPGQAPDARIGADVARSDTPPDIASGVLTEMGSAHDILGATGQVYALDRPSSGVLVTLGTARLEDATVAGRIKKVAPRPVQDPVQAATPTPEPAPVQPVETAAVESAIPAPEPSIVPAPTVQPDSQEEMVTATAPLLQNDDDLIDTAILLSEMTRSTTSEPRVYTVVAGDSLASIATRFYGSPQAAVRIFEANRTTLRAPENISVGQALVLP